MRDGGLWDSIAEIETAVRYGINVIVVVNITIQLIRTARRELRGALEEGLASGKTAFVDVFNDIEAIATFPWLPSCI